MDTRSCRRGTRAAGLRRLIAQKFFDVLNVALNLRHIRVHGNGALEVVESLDEVTQFHVAQASTTEGTKMDGVEGKGLVAITDRLLEFLHEIICRGPLVIRLSEVRSHLDDVRENGDGLWESATLHSHQTLL